MAILWMEPEIEFLGRNLKLKTKVLFELYEDSYGSVRTYDSVQKKIKQLRDAFSDAPTDDEEIDEVTTEISRIVEAGNLRLPEVTARELRESRQDTRDWLRDVITITKEEMGHLGGAVASRAVRSDKSSLVVVLSDQHFGKCSNWYNIKVGRERMRSIPINIFNSALPEIDEVVIILTGDMVEGEDIYATQNSNLECSVIEQTMACSQAIWETVLLFRELFKCPVRIETVPGNHGRMSKTANEKSNWDNVTYHIVRLLAHQYKDEGVIVNCNFEQFITFPVKDKIGMAYHKGVKHTGTPAMQTKVSGWSKTKQFDFMVHGHWHEWHIGNVLGRFVIGNGCLCGPDDLAETMGKEDDARQAYFFVTPEKPVWGFSFVEWPTDY